MPTYTLRPNATAALTGWEANPHLKLDDVVTEANTDALSASAEYVASTVLNDTFTISFPSQLITGETVTSVVAWLRWRSGAGNILGELLTGASLLASVTEGGGGTVVTDSITYTGSLTQPEVDDLRVRVTRQSGGTAARVGWIFLYVNTTASVVEIPILVMAPPIPT